MKTKKKKNILVTGSEGFIGSHLVEKLLKLNYNVKALVQYNSFNSIGWLSDINKNLLKRLNIVFGDVRDQQCTDNLCKNIDVVFNLAALISIPYSYNSSKSYLDTNVLGTNNMLHSSIKFKVKKFIQTSTSEVYGTPKIVPIKENHSLNAQSPYAASKVASDQLALSFNLSFGLPVTIIRPFNAFGPRQSLRAIIPTIITQIISGKKEIRLGNINTRRDFSYIDDTISGFIACLKNKNIEGQIINLGTGFDFSIKEVATIISKQMSAKVKFIQDKSRIRPKKSEVTRLKANPNKAKKLIGWKPEFLGKSGFIKGINQTIEWFSNEENFINYKPDLYNI